MRRGRFEQSGGRVPKFALNRAGFSGGHFAKVAASRRLQLWVKSARRWCQLLGDTPKSASVKGLRCGPLCSADGEAPGPASESLQGRKPRPGAVRYGDFAARRGLRERARRVTAARCSDRDARKPRVCCTWEGSGIAAGCISAIEPNGIARSLAETGSASSGCRRCAIVMRCRS